jgi:hypothetical protein
MSYAPALAERPTRHPFRATLPVYPVPKSSPASTRVPMGDRQLFVMTFIAGFMAFYGFLS